jgi:chromate transporter
MMEDEVVRRRRWLTRDDFLDYVGATSLIPGPNSTELAIHIGRARAGRIGLIVAGTCFIVPAALMVAVLARVYVKYGTLPELRGVLYGVKPVVIAVIAQALWSLGKAALKTRVLVIVAVIDIIAILLGVNELLVLFATGGLLAGFAAIRERANASLAIAPLLLLASTRNAADMSLTTLFAVFIKAGALLFGSGYVLLAFLRADLVERLHWLTEQQLLDAIAVGQVTPGPVFTTATFIGYVLAGPLGAIVATLGIFLPAFVFVALSGPIIPRMRRSNVAGAMLDGVNVASLAMMAAVLLQLARSALPDGFTIALAVLSAFALFKWRVNSAWLVAGGAVLGMLAVLLR